MATAKASARTLAVLAGAGFRRFATYRQATVAGAFTNTVFGFVRCYVLLSVTGAAGRVAGYDRAQLVTFVFAGQGLIAVVNFWGAADLADRVRTGEITADLLRPLDLMAGYLATDLGRAGHAMLTRFVVPVLTGLAAFDFYLPGRAWTYPLFAVSVLAAVLVCAVCRYLVNLTAFWLLDIRGVRQLWVAASTVCCGLAFPLPLLPGPAEAALWVLTPFPALLQVPLDVLVERGGTGHTALLVAGQLAWLVVATGLARLVQRRALRRLVIQGG